MSKIKNIDLIQNQMSRVTLSLHELIFMLDPDRDELALLQLRAICESLTNDVFPQILDEET